MLVYWSENRGYPPKMMTAFMNSRTVLLLPDPSLFIKKTRFLLNPSPLIQTPGLVIRGFWNSVFSSWNQSSVDFHFPARLGHYSCLLLFQILPLGNVLSPLSLSGYYLIPRLQHDLSFDPDQTKCMEISTCQPSSTRQLWNRWRKSFELKKKDLSEEERGVREFKNKYLSEE